jgi:shikimate kinase
MKNNITLIGMAGAGKSAVGKELAKKLNSDFIDIDLALVKKYGLKLQKIIDRYGEEKFLRFEEKEVLTLSKNKNYIISPGGSIIYSEKAMKFLKKNSIIIFLDVLLEMIELRIKDCETRGIIGLKDKSVAEIFKERKSLYKKWADIAIKIKNNMTVNHIAEIIISKI